MNYNESDATLRRIPVYLEDSLGVPVTGATPTGAQILVSKSGDAFANGAGTWVEVGVGNYYYQATQAETATDSYIFLIVSATGAVVFPYTVDIGSRIAMDEDLAAARRIPIYLKLAGSPVTGLTLTGAEVQVGINGAAFANGVGTATETGYGAYYYEADLTEVAAVGYRVIKVNDAGADVYVYTFDVVAVSVDAGDGSYFGSYFGGPGTTATTTTTVATSAAAVVSPYVATAPEYVDHVANAINRLAEQFKTSDD